MAKEKNLIKKSGLPQALEIRQIEFIFFTKIRAMNLYKAKIKFFFK